VPPILDSNTSPDVEMDCPFQVVESGGGYIVEGNVKNVTQVLQSGIPVAIIVDSADRGISSVSDSVYLKVYKEDSSWYTDFVGTMEVEADVYFIKIATIGSEIENLFCSSIVVQADTFEYNGLFAVKAVDPSTVTVSAGVVITGTDQSDIAGATISVSDGMCIYLEGGYDYDEDSFSFEILTSAGYPEQVFSVIKQPIAMISIVDDAIAVTQLHYGIMYIYGRGTI
jgi:hypothetical protein